MRDVLFKSTVLLIILLVSRNVAGYPVICSVQSSSAHAHIDHGSNGRNHDDGSNDHSHDDGSSEDDSPSRMRRDIPNTVTRRASRAPMTSRFPAAIPTNAMSTSKTTDVTDVQMLVNNVLDKPRKRRNTGTGYTTPVPIITASTSLTPTQTSGGTTVSSSISKSGSSDISPTISERSSTTSYTSLSPVQSHETFAKDLVDNCNNDFEAINDDSGINSVVTLAQGCSDAAQNLTRSIGVGNTLNVSTRYVDVYSTVMSLKNFTGFRYELRSADHDVTDDSYEEVFISNDVFDLLPVTEEDAIGISIVLYRKGHLFVDQRTISSDPPRRPSSHVVSITVSLSDRVVSVPVQYTLHHTELKSNNTHTEYPSCEFYNMLSEAEGEWSDYGCHVLNYSSNATQCACNHTTHFGVLLQVLETEVDPVHITALTLISYIGGGVSTGCLVLSLCILNYLKSLTSNRVRVHKNLISALTVAQSVFLSADIASRNQISCRVVALLLHYFYLAVFCWSLLEAVNLYIQIIKVFSTGKHAVKYWHYLAFGWGVPIPIVVISAGMKWDIYATATCWLTTADSLIWSFAGPVLCVITVNFIILIMVVRVIVTSEAEVRTEDYGHIKAGVKGALLLLPILSLGWVFGFLSLGSSTLIFTYIFVFSVVAQGILIFLLYCVLNSEVRIALERKLEKRRLRRGEGLACIDQTNSSVRSRETNETSGSFASKLLDKIKRSRSMTSGGKDSTPVDLMQLSHDRKDGLEMHIDVERRGSIDSGYGPTLRNGPVCCHGDDGSMASVGTVEIAEEHIAHNTPPYT